MSTVLIFGATSDIGSAIARKFARENYDLQLTARNINQLKPLQSDVKIRYGVSSSIHYFDADDFKTHRTFYQGLTVKPDVTIYVIGYMNDNEKVVADWGETLKTINANYTGAVSILNIVAADYAARQHGNIVGISSVAGNRGRQSNYIYGSAKAAFSAYLSGLRNKLYQSKVHVLTVLPGFVFTKMTDHLNLPPLLTAKPEDVANAVFNGVRKRENVVYVKWFWRWIMTIINLVPEPIFKKKKL